MQNCCIKVNPAIVHLFHGDFDGDTLSIVMPSSREALEDLPKADAMQCIMDNPADFKPGKEIGKYKKEQWSRDKAILMFQIRDIARRSTNGSSLSYEDLLDPTKACYFDGMKVNRERLTHIAKGLTKEEIFGQIPSEFSMSIDESIRDHRIIKFFTPKSGALSNSLMTLVIGKFMDKIKKDPSLISIVHKIAEAKHILCQDAISAKHGVHKTREVTRLYDALYCSNTNSVKTEGDYRRLMEELDLPKAVIDAIIEVFWKDEPENINEMLRKLAPTYLLTRRGAKFNSIEDVLEHYDQEHSIQKEFVEYLIEGVESEVERSTPEPRGHQHRVSRNEGIGSGLFGTTRTTFQVREPGKENKL